ELELDSFKVGEDLPGGDLEGVRVLVVDDNITNLLLVREMIEPFGCEVTTVTSGNAALAEVRKAQERAAPFEVAVLDLHMPEMDGLELADALRASTDSSLKLVLATSVGWMHKDEAPQHGVDGWLAKPLRRQALIGALCGVLGRRPAARRPTS